MEDGEDGGQRLTGWIAARARAHWLLVGSLVALALLLLLVPAVWEQRIAFASRYGDGGTMPRGERGVWFAALGLGLYLVAGLGAPRHWAMRPPTAAEVTVARWLIRAFGLVAIWVAFYITIPA